MPDSARTSIPGDLLMLAMYEWICAKSDLTMQVAREVRHSQYMCDRLREDALVSGAMPGDFKIMMRFKRNANGWPGARLTPELR